jgi:SAM-dependent methyltransferase
MRGKATWSAATDRQADIGYETLRRMASVEQYNYWLFSEVRPFVGQRVLEVGCGIGNMTPFFLDRNLVVAIDILAAAARQVREKFAQWRNLHVYQGDILDAGLVAQLQDYGFDTVICFNVLEHIENDAQALQHILRLLIPGGRLLLIVPAGPFLYGTIDEGLGHQRRYTRDGLRTLVEGQGFHIERLYYLNLLGIPGWFLSSRILRQRILPRLALWLFNVLARVFIPLENALRQHVSIPYGQSLVCIARR